MESLSNKNAVITGAGKGIGKAIALALAAEGVNVGLIARTESDLQSVKAEIGDKVKVSIAVADVSEMQQVNTAIEKIQAELGFIDIAVNNAGIGVFAKFMDMEPAQWAAIIQANLMGPYYVTRAILPAMIENKTGDIINISSTAGKSGGANTSAYSASKFGLIGLSESLMQEVRKHNIRVTTLTPSTVVTELAQSNNLITGDAERVMHPEDIAELIIAQLKLNRRTFVKESAMWSTNP